MLNLLIITIIMLLAGACAVRIFDRMAQEGGALDVLFNWQQKLQSLHESKSRWKNLAGKALGDCSECTAFWFMPIWTVLYIVFCNVLIGHWVTGLVDGIGAKIFVGFIGYIIFHSVGATLGYYLITWKNKV